MGNSVLGEKIEHEGRTYYLHTVQASRSQGWIIGDIIIVRDTGDPDTNRKVAQILLGRTKD